MKVLFMDIDGVLNSDLYLLGLQSDQLRNPENHIDPSLVERMNRLLQETGAKVVISSAWREEFHIRVLRSILVGRGFTGDIVGSTPSRRVVGRPGPGPRGEEIQAWLDENGSSVDSFAIVDDSMDMGRELYPRTVYTDPMLGLQDNDVLRLKELLK